VLTERGHRKGGGGKGWEGWERGVNEEGWEKDKGGGCEREWCGGGGGDGLGLAMLVGMGRGDGGMQ